MFAHRGPALLKLLVKQRGPDSALALHLPLDLLASRRKALSVYGRPSYHSGRVLGYTLSTGVWLMKVSSRWQLIFIFHSTQVVFH